MTARLTLVGPPGAPLPPAAPMEAWVTLIKSTEKGAWAATLPNAVTIFTHHPDWIGVLGFDEVANAAVFLKAPRFDADMAHPGPFPCAITDVDSVRFLTWLERKYGMSLKHHTMAGHAADIASRRNTFNPVTDYLGALVWDGHARLDTWLQCVCGAEDNEYTSAVGVAWMISAVARAFEPACQADYALVLEGPQGLKKSTVFRILGGRWSCSVSTSAKGKDAFTGLQGMWISELAELDTVRSADSSAVKNFITTRDDWFREPYAARNSRHPRRGIFGGSTNECEYLHDTTGGRRWWGVRCSPVTPEGTLDTDLLVESRDQLWAEAVHLYRSGVPWHLDVAHEAMAGDEQEQRRAMDPWEATIQKFLLHGKKEEVTNADLFSIGCIAKDIGNVTRPDAGRAGACMAAIGWIRSGRKQVNGRQDTYYVPRDLDTWRKALATYQHPPGPVFQGH